MISPTKHLDPEKRDLVHNGRRPNGGMKQIVKKECSETSGDVASKNRLEDYLVNQILDQHLQRGAT